MPVQEALQTSFAYCRLPARNIYSSSWITLQLQPALTNVEVSHHSLRNKEMDRHHTAKWFVKQHASILLADHLLKLGQKLTFQTAFEFSTCTVPFRVQPSSPSPRLHTCTIAILPISAAGDCGLWLNSLVQDVLQVGQHVCER